MDASTGSTVTAVGVVIIFIIVAFGPSRGKITQMMNSDEIMKEDRNGKDDDDDDDDK